MEDCRGRKGCGDLVDPHSKRKHRDDGEYEPDSEDESEEGEEGVAVEGPQSKKPK